jgi:hypothetical protein
MTAPAAVQQILFDALAGQSGGAGQLSPDEIALIGEIARSLIELHTASATDAARIAATIAASIAKLPRSPEAYSRIDPQADLSAKFTQLEVEHTTLKAEHSTLLRLHLAHMDDPANAADPKIAMLKATLENREQQIVVLDKLVADLDAKLATMETGQ